MDKCLLILNIYYLFLFSGAVSPATTYLNSFQLWGSSLISFVHYIVGE